LTPLSIKSFHQLKEVGGIHIDGQPQAEPGNDRRTSNEILLNRENTTH